MVKDCEAIATRESTMMKKSSGILLVGKEQPFES